MTAVADLIEPTRLLGRRLGVAAEAAENFMACIAAAMNDDEAFVYGQAGKFYVRAGLDPEYVDPDARDRLVRQILAGKLHAIEMLTPENRRIVASWAMAGWAKHRKSDDVVLTWHRLLGTTTVQVASS